MPYTIRAAVEGVGPRADRIMATTPLPSDQTELAFLLGALVTRALLAGTVQPQDYFASGALRVELDLLRNEDLDKPRPVIKRARVAGSHRQHELSSALTPADVQRAVGFPSTGGSDKTSHEWEFSVDGELCAVWFWHGRSWSAYGPHAALVKVFGAENVL